MKIAFIGGGHMAQALIAGLHDSADIIVADRNADKRESLAQRFGVSAVAALPADTVADAIVLAVRPAQALDAAAALPAAGTLVSVAAGLQCADLSAASGREAARLIRIMPNTPSQVGMGMAFGYADAAVSEGDRALVQQLFSAVGRLAWVTEERLLDVATAVSGSGPAYIYYYIAAMIDTARAMGLEEEVAQQAVLQTIRGACEMVGQSPQTPAQLTAAVAVPRGTTASALAVMEKAGLDQTVKQAMEACAARAKEIGEELRQQNKR